MRLNLKIFKNAMRNPSDYVQKAGLQADKKRHIENPHLSLAWETPQLRHLPDIKRSLTNVPTEQLPKPMTTPAHQEDHQTAEYKMGNVQKVPRTKCSPTPSRTEQVQEGDTASDSNCS